MNYKFEILEIVGNQARVEFENVDGLFYSRFVTVPKSAEFDITNLNTLKTDKSFMDIMQGIQQGLAHKENLGVTEFRAKETNPPKPVIPE